MITSKEVQGPGRAYWFDNAEEAEKFAQAKREKGHIVTFHKDNNYVWHSFSWKKHNLRAHMVGWGYDTLAV